MPCMPALLAPSRRRAPTPQAEKLSRVKNPLARNLLSIMLQKDPNRRPAVATVLKVCYARWGKNKMT